MCDKSETMKSWELIMTGNTGTTGTGKMKAKHKTKKMKLNKLKHNPDKKANKQFFSKSQSYLASLFQLTWLDEVFEYELIIVVHLQAAIEDWV